MNSEPTTDAPILVTGGTGTLGRLVVARLLKADKSVRVLSRGRHAPRDAANSPDERVEYVTADLATGDGVAAALDGVKTVIHVAGTAKGDDGKALNLVNGAQRAGVRHVVYISVVGADRIPVKSALDRAMFGYFAAKLAAEQLIANSGVPWTSLRSTQFQEAIFMIVQGMSRLPIAPVPAGWKFQPIDPAEVADRLVELALGAPQGLVAEMGGPRIYELADLLRSYLHATGKHRLIVGMPTPGGAARAVRAGANLTPDHAVGRRTWEEFLADQLQPAATRRQTSVVGHRG